MISILSVLFILGYVLIAFEHKININKAAIALISGVLLWSICIYYSTNSNETLLVFNEKFSSIAGILFFLLGAMTIVELVDAHQGFDVITAFITTTNKRKLLWSVGLITFFLSSVLDNLTSTIVIISLLRKLIENAQDRKYFVGLTIIAANAGGAFSPIGDVTTTMLWIDGQISSWNIISHLFLPSLTCMLVPTLALSYQLKGTVECSTHKTKNNEKPIVKWEQNVLFIIGTGALLFVPIFKTITHLPPFMGILFGLSIVWIATELMHRNKIEIDKEELSVMSALRKIDTTSILFFLGILMSVACLETTHILAMLSTFLNTHIGNQTIILTIIGLLSAVIDNVPLVAAAQGMYTLVEYPQNHFIWTYLAYTAGTGGSCLIIGSAAGVAAMGMEKINFMWYAKRIAPFALIGYFAGCLVYILLINYVF